MFSIAPNYEPELIIHDLIISDNEVHIFDVMFQRFSDILQEYYTKEDEFILNLSSATPQIKSALFVINRLNGINVKAVQVSSPEHASNENIGHDNDENIEKIQRYSSSRFIFHDCLPSSSFRRPFPHWRQIFRR